MITIAVINEELAMEATWDRIIVEEDPYKDGRACTTCGGLGHCNVACDECHGNGRYRGKSNSEADCTTCTIGEGPMRRTLKHLPCVVCKGSGTSSIVIPDDAQERPTTGVIRSVGPLCGYVKMGGELVKIPEEACLHVGDRVLYHKHTGNIFELGGRGELKIRYLKESEVLGKLKGVMKKTPTHGEFTELSSVGVQS